MGHSSSNCSFYLNRNNFDLRLTDHFAELHIICVFREIEDNPRIDSIPPNAFQGMTEEYVYMWVQEPKFLSELEATMFFDVMWIFSWNWMFGSVTVQIMTEN